MNLPAYLSGCETGRHHARTDRPDLQTTPPRMWTPPPSTLPFRAPYATKPVDHIVAGWAALATVLQIPGSGLLSRGCLGCRYRERLALYVRICMLPRAFDAEERRVCVLYATVQAIVRSMERGHTWHLSRFCLLFLLARIAVGSILS